MKKSIFVLVTGIIILMSGCTKKETATKQYITVSILPQKFFVEKITGNRFEINVLLPPGVSPHTFEPPPSSLIQLSKSLIYFTSGHLDFEKTWFEKFRSVNPGMNIIDTSAGVELISNKGKDNHEEEHEGEIEDQDHHEHAGIDPHIWMSVKEVKVQCKNILDAVIKTDPENKELYLKNFDTFILDLDKLDMQIRTMLTGLETRKFIIYHPALGYFARDYDLEEISVEMDGKDPAPEDLKNLIDTAKADGIKVIFVQKQFDTRQAESIASEIGGKVMPLDHLSEDWLNNMIAVARTFQFELK